MKKAYIQKLAWIRKKIADPYNAKAWLDLELFVPKPTRDNPLPCILVSIRNGHSKLFFRLEDVSGFTKGFALTRRMKDRLKLGLVTANIEADEIEKDMRLLMMRRKHPASALVDTTTGEFVTEGRVLYQVEQILKESGEA